MAVTTSGDILILFQIPADVDARVMLTFLELYQTLLGFVFFKLYADAGLVYPPPLDVKKDETGAGVGAFSLQETAHNVEPTVSRKTVEVDGKKISSKAVRQTIKSITASNVDDADVDITNVDSSPTEVDEQFVPQPFMSDSQQEATSLPTLQSLSVLPQSLSTSLFSPFTFFLSRESSRPIFEFIIRSFGGRIGWSPSSGSGSPFGEDDDSITHVIIDRPVVKRSDETPEMRERRLRRKWVQPQWVVDCINAGRILLEEPYAQGKTLPPHLSPFGEHAGAYDPTVGLTSEDAVMAEAKAAHEESEEEEDEDEDGKEKEAEHGDHTQELRPEEIVLKAAASAASDDSAALRAAELAAEAAGVEYGTFEKEVAKSQKKLKKKADGPVEGEGEQDMNKMMMSNKKKKLYERMKYGEKKKATEV
jgi:pescadillo protein